MSAYETITYLKTHVVWKRQRNVYRKGSKDGSKYYLYTDNGKDILSNTQKSNRRQPEKRAGFRAGRSTTDNLFILKVALGNRTSEIEIASIDIIVVKRYGETWLKININSCCSAML